MSRGQTVRAWVRERVTAAAEEISALFERTTAENEEELCRSKDENRRKRQLLDVILTETQRIKEEPEEQSVSQEEELLPGPATEFSAVCVKPEESSPLQRRQTEHRKETQGEEDSSSETGRKTEISPDTDNDDDCSPAQTETTVHNEDKTGAEKKHQCLYCHKKFNRNYHLRLHIRVHTGEKPYRCSFCEKTFSLRGSLEKHKRIHTGQKPYSCSTCEKSFARKQYLDSHRRRHTGEKPYSCATCSRLFAEKSSLNRHKRRAHLSTERKVSEEYPCDVHFVKLQ